MYLKLEAQIEDFVPLNKGYTQNFSGSVAPASFCIPTFKYATTPLK